MTWHLFWFALLVVLIKIPYTIAYMCGMCLYTRRSENSDWSNGTLYNYASEPTLVNKKIGEILAGLYIHLSVYIVSLSWPLKNEFCWMPLEQKDWLISP